MKTRKPSVQSLVLFFVVIAGIVALPGYDLKALFMAGFMLGKMSQIWDDEDRKK